MSIFQTFLLAAESIRSRKMRSFLTMLGMIIGVFSVITLVGIMHGVTNYILSTLTDMVRTDSITVSVTNTDTRVVNVDDLYAFINEHDDVFVSLSPKIALQYTVKNKTISETETITGVGEDYIDMNNLTLASGRFINYADVKERFKGCVIGSFIADEIYNGAVSAGDTLKINGNNFTIIGILEENADSEENSQDDCIYIPYSTANRLAQSTRIGSYMVTAVDTDHVDEGKDLLDNYIYGIVKDEDLYNVSTMSILMDSMNQVSSMLGMVLYGIAGISLLVAGIGIMNIMLVSVVERTKEIGIRKSLGAKTWDIMWQFVIEAAAISSFGGIVGIVFGWLVTSLVGNLIGVDASPGIGAIIVSFSISAGIGIGFGYAPAKKAANLNPIDALRAE